MRIYDRVQIYFQKKCYFPNMCSLKFVVFKLLILYQFSSWEEFVLFIQSKNSEQNFCVYVCVLLLFRQKSLMQCIFSWASLFLLEIYCQKKNAVAILYFLFLPKIQWNPEGLESYAQHCCCLWLFRWYILPFIRSLH